MTHTPAFQSHILVHLHRQNTSASESKMSTNDKIRGIRIYMIRRKNRIHPPVFNSDDDWTQFGGVYSVFPSNVVNPYSPEFVDI